MAQALSIVQGVFGRACLLDKNRRVGPHAHPEPHVIVKIAGADLEYEVGAAVAPCTRDRVVLVNALELHGNRTIGKDHSVILALYLSPQWLVDHHPSLLAGGRLFHTPSAPVTPRLRHLADRSAAEMLQGSGVAESRLQFLVSEIAFAVFEVSALPLEQVDRLGKLNDFRIRRAVACMRESVGSNVELAEIAARVGLSRSRFFDLFTACTGLAPKQYLDMLRMDATIGALARTRQSIAEIAEACGYSAQMDTTSILTPEQRDFWATNGWLVLPDLLDANIRAALAGWVDPIARPAADGESRLHYFEQTDAGRTLCRTERFIEDSAALHSLITQGALPGMAGELMGGEPALIYKEKVNYKQPGGAGFAPHQDATAYAFVKKHVTCLVAVDPMTPDNGCLEFAPGSRDELLPGDGDGCIAPEVAATLAWQVAPVPAGAVVFFSSYTPHRSAANRSARPRRALYLTYNAAAEGDHRSAYYAGRERAIEAARAAGGAAARVSTIGHFQGRATDAAATPAVPRFNGDADAFVDQLLAWMAAAGATRYDESVTQFEHALQSAALAREQGHADALVAAALLHDVGHLLADEHDGHGDFLLRDLHHERIGARWLARVFGPEVTEPIVWHVDAKRYLCSIDPAYHDGLSQSSRRSLQVQGGLMNDDERRAFAARPGAEAAAALRRIDDLSKRADFEVPGGEAHRKLLLKLAGRLRTV